MGGGTNRAVLKPETKKSRGPGRRARARASSRLQKTPQHRHANNNMGTTTPISSPSPCSSPAGNVSVAPTAWGVTRFGQAMEVATYVKKGFSQQKVEVECVNFHQVAFLPEVEVVSEVEEMVEEDMDLDSNSSSSSSLDSEEHEDEDDDEDSDEGCLSGLASGLLLDDSHSSEDDEDDELLESNPDQMEEEYSESEGASSCISSSSEAEEKELSIAAVACFGSLLEKLGGNGGGGGATGLSTLSSWARFAENLPLPPRHKLARSTHMKLVWFHASSLVCHNPQFSQPNSSGGSRKRKRERNRSFGHFIGDGNECNDERCIREAITRLKTL